MATPMPDSYSAATGQGIYAGRYNTVPMDVVNYLWTPTTDNDGYILDGSWNNLPIDEWCDIAGTEMQGLEDKIVAAMGKSISALNYGTGNILATFNSYCGIAIDLDGGFAHEPWGGGHNDSSINGIWSIDLEKMGSFYITQNPSDPEDPTYPWSTEYKNSGSFTGYIPVWDDPSDILPDSMPTSRHQYNGLWYDPVRNTINQSRRRLWQHDLDTGVTSFVKWNQGGSLIYGDQGAHIYWDEIAEEPVGYFPTNPSDTYHWAKMNPDTGEVTNLSGRNVGISGITWRIGRDIHLIDQGNNYRQFNLDTRQWHDEVVLTDNQVYTWEQQLQVAVYIPEWGKVLRRFTYGSLTGKWFLFDPITKTHEAYSPQGISVSFAEWPGNKCFYYPRRKCVIYINPTLLSQPSISIMRVG